MSTTDTLQDEKVVFNTKRAEMVLRSILALPDEHNQEQWFEVIDFDALPEEGKVDETDDEGVVTKTRTITVNSMMEGTCGTTACIAGWAALHAGWKFNTTMEISPHDGWTAMTYETISPTGESEHLTSTPDLETQGAEALGLTHEQAQTLFFTMDEKFATVQLYALIKGLPMDLLDVANHFDIDTTNDDDNFDLDLNYEDEIVDQIIDHIKVEYPPFSSGELFDSLA